MKFRPFSAARRGTASVLILFLTTVLFIAVVFSIDVARIQLAQLELQSAADLVARAGAEAMSRGVGDPNDLTATDIAIRNEIDMIAQLNTVAGNPLVLNLNQDIAFGRAEQDETTNAFSIISSLGGTIDANTDTVSVAPVLNNFPVVFGGFVSRDTVGLGEVASAMISERDIVVVLDRSTSMLTFDAGTLDVSQYDAELMQLEDDLYGPADAHYPNTEFDLNGTTLTLSRIQALKLAVLKFREEIDASQGHEQLGLATYSDVADDPSGAYVASPNLRAGDGSLLTSIESQLVGTGASTNTEVYASALEAYDTGYENFDMNYMGMRRKSSTNIVAGIEKGVEILYGPGRRPLATPVLILMTDGRHNRAGTPENAATAAKTAHPELLIYTVTFGAGAEKAPMIAVANTGEGTHNHANDVNQLVLVFKDLANAAGVTLIK